jgi:hypothetical protein
MKRLMIPLCLLISALAGCGDGARYVSVSGKVTMNQQPLANATVTFQPIASEGMDAKAFGSFALTDAEGNFTLEVSSPTPMKGAAVGKHIVRIGTKPSTINNTDSDAVNPGGKGAPKLAIDPIPTRYNSESQLKFDVPAGGTTAANFDLTKP